MSDTPPTPDDLLVSAVLDGVASPDDVARVAADPRLSARLEQFRAVAEAVRGPVPLVDPVVRDAHLARARDAFGHAGTVGADTRPLVAPGATTPPPPADFAAARAQRARRARPRAILSIAAAVVLVVAAGAFLVRLGGSSPSGDDAEVAATAPPALESDDTSSGAEAFAPEAGAPASTTPTTVADAPGSAAAGGAAGSGVDESLPSLGEFSKADDLAARVRGELLLDPTPADRVTDETCRDDFDVEVTLLGRAAVAGETGLVYVEATPSGDRHLWFVDPGSVGADDTCRQIIPVQTL